MKEKHIYEALKYLYDNNSDEDITEEKLQLSVTNIHPKYYNKIREILILEGFISPTSTKGLWKITNKGIDYLMNNPTKIKRDIDYIKIFTIAGAVISLGSLIMAILQYFKPN